MVTKRQSVETLDSPTPRKRASVARLRHAVSRDRITASPASPSRSPRKKVSVAQLRMSPRKKVQVEVADDDHSQISETASKILQDVGLKIGNLSIRDNESIPDLRVSPIPSSEHHSTTESGSNSVSSMQVQCGAPLFYQNAEFHEASSPELAKLQFHCVTSDRISFFIPLSLFSQLPFPLRREVMQAHLDRCPAFFDLMDERALYLVLCTLRPIHDWPWPPRNELFPTVESAAQFARMWVMENFNQRVADRASTMLFNDPWALYGVAIALDHLQLGAQALLLIDEEMHGTMPDDIAAVVQRRNDLMRSFQRWQPPNPQVALRVEEFRVKLINHRPPFLDWDEDCQRKLCTLYRTYDGEFALMYAYIADFVFERVQKGLGEALSLGNMERMRAFANLVLPCRRCVNKVVGPLSQCIAASTGFIQTMNEALADLARLNAARDRLFRVTRLLEASEV